MCACCFVCVHVAAWLASSQDKYLTIGGIHTFSNGMGLLIKTHTSCRSLPVVYELNHDTKSDQLILIKYGQICGVMEALTCQSQEMVS